MWYTCITTLAISFHNDKEVVFADISIPNTSTYKIIDLIIPVDEWAEIAISVRQNTENEHCETQKKLVHKLILHNLSCFYIKLNVVFVYYNYSNLSLYWESGGISRYS